MPSIDRPLSGDVLTFDLHGEREALERPAAASARSGPSAKTLVKDGPLRVTLITLGAGGEIAEHAAEGPISIHCLEGALHFRAGERTWRLEPGGLLTAGPGVRHAVASEHGATFLLTLTQRDG